MTVLQAGRGEKQTLFEAHGSRRPASLRDLALACHRRFERLFDALIDPARCERTVVVLLAAYAAAWAVYAAIAHSSQDTHFDMGELFAWSHEVILSAPTHPPLGPWLVHAWFAVMPAEPWSYYLLGVIIATIALWIAWRVAGLYLSAEKRILALILLTFVPFYNFHAFKLNANTLMTPLWAATTWWFLRSFETRRTGWAVLAGLGAAGAMLAKYWSIFLLAGLGLAALRDPRRSAYFASAAPRWTIAIGLIVLLPHLVFISTHGLTTLAFAFTSHGATFKNAMQSAVSFVLGALGYIVVPVALGVVATRPDTAAIDDTLWPGSPERRTLAVAFVAPLVLAVPAAVLLRDSISAIWVMPAMTLFPVVLLASPKVNVIRDVAVRLLALAIGFPLVMIALSPVIAVAIHRKGLDDYQAQYGLIAAAVERAWEARTNAPLRIIGSYRNVVDGTAFYFRERPRTYSLTDVSRTPWVDEESIRRDGIAIFCPEDQAGCVGKMLDYAVRYGAEAEAVTLAREFLGAFDPPVRYAIVIIPPGQKDAPGLLWEH